MVIFYTDSFASGLNNVEYHYTEVSFINQNQKGVIEHD